MKAITLDKIEQGMILASDVLTNKGQVLLKSGIVFDDYYISLLSKYNIDIVLVNLDDEPVREMTSEERNYYLQQIRPEKKKIFANCIEDTYMYELYEAIVQNSLWEMWNEKQK